ncbi:MAG TPA: GlsB/YeaQ/YmgE family stress response membrane protein [Xanthomonadaceae bacterium]|jgi:uncharacterized membrane protein YeaQ/YmgE (transglycosylase-associated protein family)|nr:GlsB/YeaQ/YmgE family stress response membrane protein [Xanthomonadaceae bacterium]
MNILYTILIGFVIGLIARALKPGDDRMGILMTTLFGIGGALIAKYVGLSMGWYGDDDPVGFIASVAGAIVLLTIFALVRPKKKS